MGLDIYIRWYGMTEDERNAQFTGYDDAPEVGYLRFNWPGVRAVTLFCNENDLKNPIPMVAVWDGNNGESLPITTQVIDVLQEDKRSMMDSLVSFDFDVWGEVGEYVKRKIECSIKLIEFIESHADKPDLTLEWN